MRSASSASSSTSRPLGMPVRRLMASSRESRLVEGRKLIGSVFTLSPYHRVNIVNKRSLPSAAAGRRRAGGAHTRWVEAMGTYEDAIDTLEAELNGIRAVFHGLSEAEWKVSTGLQPLDPSLPHWTVFELAGHFD